MRVSLTLTVLVAVAADNGAFVRPHPNAPDADSSTLFSAQQLKETKPYEPPYGAAGPAALLQTAEARQADALVRAALGAKTDPAVAAPHPVKAERRAAPRFYECVEEKRVQAESSCGGRCDVVWVGDSLLEDMLGHKCYWDRPLDTGSAWAASPLRKGSLVLAGSMDMTQHALYMLQAVLPSLRRPKLFFLLIGTNNIGTALMTPAQTASGVRAVLHALRSAFPETTVLLHTQLPRYDEPDHKGVLQLRLDVLDRELAEYVREQAPAVQLLNCSGVFPRGPALSALMPDFLHPSTEGYRQWLHCLQPEIKSALRRVETEEAELA